MGPVPGRRIVASQTTEECCKKNEHCREEHEVEDDNFEDNPDEDRSKTLLNKIALILAILWSQAGTIKSKNDRSRKK